MDNKLMEVMLNRRSVRSYTGEPIAEDRLEAIVDAGLAAPNGRNRKSVELVVVRDKAMLEALSRCREHGPGMLAGADAAIVVLGNTELNDVWTEDACNKIMMMHLMADYLGVGSCWVQGRLRMAPDGRTAEEYIRELLGFPENYRLEAILSLGMPAEHAPATAIEELDRDLVHYEKF